MPERFLSRKGKRTLIDWVAANGESYRLYKPFAQRMGWRIYTPGSFHSFVNRNRTSIEAARISFEEKVKEETYYVKSKRVRVLEAEVDALLLAATDETNPIIRLKLSEQIRRNLQAISQELGEWNKEQIEVAPPTGYALIEALKAKQLPVTTEYVILEDEEPEE